MAQQSKPWEDGQEPISLSTSVTGLAKQGQLDFEIEFSNGGGIQGQGFRLDIAGDDIADDQLAAYIIRVLRLLMVGSVRILKKQIIEERHKRSPAAAQTPGLPGRSSAFVALTVGAPVPAQQPGSCTLVLGTGVRMELPALPAPEWLAALGRAMQGAR